MTRFAGILSLAVAGAIAGCDSAQPVQTATPAQVPMVFAPQTQVVPAVKYMPASPFPASSVLSTGNLPLPPNNGLPFVDPLQDFTDMQIQFVDEQGDGQGDQTQPDLNPETQPVTRIVAADTLPATEPEMLAEPVPPVYVPVYVPQYVPEYVPQVIVVQAPPQVIFQQEYIPFPVFEPIFILDRHRPIDYCGIEVNDHHRRQVAVLVNRPGRVPSRALGTEPTVQPLIVPPLNGGNGAALAVPSVLPVKSIPVKSMAAAPAGIAARRTDAARTIVTPSANAAEQPTVLKKNQPAQTVFETAPVLTPPKTLTVRNGPKRAADAKSVVIRPPVVTAPNAPQVPVVVKNETVAPKVIVPPVIKNDEGMARPKIDPPKPAIVTKVEEPKVETKAQPVIKAEPAPKPTRPIVSAPPVKNPQPQPVRAIPTPRPAPIQSPPVIRVSAPVIRTPAPIVTPMPPVRSIAPAKTDDKGAGGAPVIPTRSVGRPGR